jgi:hypothetical protein
MSGKFASQLQVEGRATEPRLPMERPSLLPDAEPLAGVALLAVTLCAVR